MKDIVKFPLVLLAITVICGGILSGLYNITKGPIEKAAEAKKEKSLNEIFGKDMTYETMKKSIRPEGSDKEINFEYFKVTVGDKTYYATVGESDRCYTSSSPLRIMVGVDSEFNITKIAVVRSSETPGLGENIKKTKAMSLFDLISGKKDENPDEDKREWLSQFNEISVDKAKIKKDGGDIDAIAGATITSRAVTYAVESAIANLKIALNTK